MLLALENIILKEESLIIIDEFYYDLTTLISLANEGCTLGKKVHCAKAILSRFKKDLKEFGFLKYENQATYGKVAELLIENHALLKKCVELNKYQRKSA